MTTVFLAVLFLAVTLFCLAVTAVFDAIEKSTSKRGYPASVFRRKP